MSNHALALARRAGVVEGLLRADRALTGESRIPLAPLASLALQRHEREGWLVEGQVVTHHDKDGWLIVERYEGTRQAVDTGRPEAVLTRLHVRELAHYRRQLDLARQLGVDSDDTDRWEKRIAWLTARIREG